MEVGFEFIKSNFRVEVLNDINIPDGHVDLVSLFLWQRKSTDDLCSLVYRSIDRYIFRTKREEKLIHNRAGSARALMPS